LYTLVEGIMISVNAVMDDPFPKVLFILKVVYNSERAGSDNYIL